MAPDHRHLPPGARWWRLNWPHAVVITIALIAYAVSRYFGLFEAFYAFSRAHDAWGLDEIVMALSISGISFTALSFVHLRQLSQEIQRRASAEAALSASAARFRALVENSSDAITLIDRAGVVIYDSPAAPGLLGYAPNELVGQNAFELMHPDEVPANQALLEQVSAQPGARARATFRLRHASGDWRWIEASATNLLSDPSVKAIVVNYRDITERRRGEAVRQALLEIMQGLAVTDDLKALLGLVHQAIAKVMYAENFFVTLYNPDTGLFEEAYSVDQYDPPAPPSRLEKSISAYVFRSGHPLLLTQARFDELVALGEVSLVGTNSPSWLGVPLKTSRGTIGVMVVQDYERDERYSEHDAEILASMASQVALAVQRRRAGAALAASEQRFRALIENAPDGISLLSSEGRLIYTSPATERILGYAAEAAVGQDPAALTHPEDLAAVLEALESVAGQPGRSVLAQYRMRHMDGAWRWLESMVTNQLANPNVGAYVINFRDITARRQHERELEAVARLSAALRNAADRAEMLPVVLDQTLDLVDAAGAVLALRDPARGEIVVELGSGIWADRTGQRRRAALGLMGAVIEAGRVYVTADVRTDPRVTRPEGVGEAVAEVYVPLIAREANLGGLWVCRRTPFEPGEVRVLTALGDIVASALQRATLFEQTQRGLQRITALRAIDAAITGSLDVRVTLEAFLEQVTAQLRVDAADVLLREAHTNTLAYAAGRGFRTSAIQRAQARLGEGQAGRSALDRRMIVVPDLRQVPAATRRTGSLQAEGFVSYFAIPLIAKGQVNGVLEIFHRERLEPDPEWLNFLETLAGQAAIAIDSANLFHNLQRSNADLILAYDTTIEGWSRALDLRDHETEGHSRRVTGMTVQMLRAQGVGEAALVHARRGALLHDIGKMGIPDHILMKPGPLTEEEWVIMRRHPTYAYELLSPIAFLRPALDIPYCHHEQWDGSGYPRGLKGDQIPIAARVFAVADVWDALRSDRPYRMAWPADRVHAYIRSESGTRFDPDAVSLFLTQNWRLDP